MNEPDQRSDPDPDRDLYFLSSRYKPDTRFSTPKGQVYLALMNRESYEDPKAAVSTNLLTKLLVDSMNEVTYYAEVAGLAYAIQSTTVGLQLIFSG